MPAWLAGLLIVLGLYAAFVVALMLSGRRSTARALAGFIPDCLILVRRLLGDARLGRGHKLLLIGLFGYLVSPLDLVPDFIPIAGTLDDALIATLVLRVVLRGGGVQLLHQHWPGPKSSRDLVERAVFGATSTAG